MASGLMALLQTALQVPVWEYSILLCVFLTCFLYSALEFYFLEDLFSAFRGQRAQLFYSRASSLAHEVLPRCKLLKKRYWATPWLCSPHVQTAFLHFFGRPPTFDYRRQLYRTPDGGTIALDWLNPIYTENGNVERNSSAIDLDETCIAIVIPGLTSDSADAYVKHIAYSLAASGRRVVVANHRGLGGVSITSNQLYNAGWTEDLRRIIHHLHQIFPKAPLLAVGTSIGANILVKYLGEEGDNTPLAAGAAICCPWDLLVCDRFICRRLIQRIYDKILAFGLRSYAEMHQGALSKMADWDLISKSRSVRDFDNHCTRIVSQYETVDTYYRKCSSSYYLHSVSIPLFCISSMDDPVCTKEAIPFDECRANQNVLLGLTKHGGHLAFFEGLTASSIWWVNATVEFLDKLCATSLLHVPKEASMVSSGLTLLPERNMDKFPYVSVFQHSVAAAEEISLTTRELEVASENSRERLPSVGAFQPSMATAQETPGTTGELATIPENENEQEELQIIGVTQASMNPPLVLSLRDNETGNNRLIASPSSSSSSSTSSELTEPYQHSVKLSVRNSSELVMLESLLSQCLQQIDGLKKGKKENEWPVVAPGIQLSAGVSNQINDNGHNTGLKLRAPASSNKGIRDTSQQNKRKLWLLAYVTIISACPIVGPALFTYGRRRLKTILTKYWAK